MSQPPEHSKKISRTGNFIEIRPETRAHLDQYQARMQKAARSGYSPSILKSAEADLALSAKAATFVAYASDAIRNTSPEYSNGKAEMNAADTVLKSNLDIAYNTLLEALTIFNARNNIMAGPEAVEFAARELVRRRVPEQNPALHNFLETAEPLEALMQSGRLKHFHGLRATWNLANNGAAVGH